MHRNVDLKVLYFGLNTGSQTTHNLLRERGLAPLPVF
ncbi:MAG: hypothetical protein JWM19_4157 [Actinomycetia bacterium]|nr:hypothetical protein [Actinomycetes bacterium]